MTAPTTEELELIARLQGIWFPKNIMAAIRWLAQAELSRREEVKPAKCVCELAKIDPRRKICGCQFQHKKGGISAEYCANILDSGEECGHDRACHGGEK